MTAQDSTPEQMDTFEKTGEGVEADEFQGILKELAAAGLSFGGGIGAAPNEVNIGIYFDHETFYPFGSMESASIRAAIQGDNQETLPGYSFDVDTETGVNQLTYSGPYNGKFKEVIGALVDVAKTCRISDQPDQSTSPLSY